ncbi:hypothetical protein L1049_012679 [Liquidambar formosana]|uniref:Uncharacterized protein n=1 Tax=Liquidambar formosana TaxID=63359 RepID=A0AAP0N6S0_LIQFO
MKAFLIVCILLASVLLVPSSVTALPAHNDRPGGRTPTPVPGGPANCGRKQYPSCRLPRPPSVVP